MSAVDPFAHTDYRAGRLDESDVDPDPLVQLQAWVDQAAAAGVVEPLAMTLATVDPSGAPSARVVLLRGIHDGSLWLFTNYRSPKAEDLDRDGRCAAVFVWPDVQRQVRVTGTATRLGAAESDAYFASRPRGSQVGAWASPQSEVIDDRTVLEARVAEVEARFGAGPVPRPEHWGGFGIRPTVVELWQGRTSRLHDRLRYRRDGGRWILERLAP